MSRNFNCQGISILFSIIISSIFDILKIISYIIIIILYLKMSFSSTLSQGRQPNLWRHFTRFNSTNSGKTAVSQLSPLGYWAEFLVAGCPSTQPVRIREYTGIWKPFQRELNFRLHTTSNHEDQIKSVMGSNTKIHFPIWF